MGSEYEDKIVLDVLEFYNEKNFKHYHTKEELINETSKILQNKVMSFFQGRSEFGPRALGSRSILANPAKLEMRDIINKKIKFREIFARCTNCACRKSKRFFEINNIDNHYQPKITCLCFKSFL